MSDNNVDLVRYHNDLNRLQFSDLKEKELDLFFKICLFLKNKKDTIVELDLTDVRNSFSIANKNRLDGYFRTVIKKFLSTSGLYEVDGRLIGITFFRKIEVNQDRTKMLVQVDEEYSFMFNELIANYTKFDYCDYKSLKSKYSKMLFQKIKQWESIGYIVFDVNELYDYFGLTPQMRTTANFNNKVYKHLLKDLTGVVSGFSAEKIKKHNKIIQYKFCWNIPKKDKMSSVHLKQEKKSVLRKSDVKQGYIEGRQDYTDRELFPDVFE